MRPRKCVIEVKDSCDNCPHFDNGFYNSDSEVYFSGEVLCKLLGDFIPNIKDHKIPENCPLPYWAEQDDEVNKND